MASLRKNSSMLTKYAVIRSRPDGTFELVPVNTVFTQRMKNNRQDNILQQSIALISTSKATRSIVLEPDLSSKPVEAFVELETIDEGLQGEGEGLGGVDEGINGNDDDHIQKDKDDIDDEIEAMKFTDDHEGVDDDEKEASGSGDRDTSYDSIVMKSLRTYKRKRDELVGST
jgi:hypothetical protein